VQNRYEPIEEKIHGRGRNPGTDEDMFGIFRKMYVARMKEPVPGSQWTGMVTSVASLLLEKKLVDGIVCVQTVPGTKFKPLPSVATSVEELRSSVGNKPCLSPNLSALDQATKLGVKRLAFIGNGCQTHALRGIEHTLPFEKIYYIGMPCTDVVTYQKWNRFLEVVSKSPSTVVHLEFMPDYRVWVRHENGHTEKIGFVELDVDKMGKDIFPDSCLSCFDYTNSLSDITIGYLGAPMPYQWVLVRTDTGEEMLEMLRPYLNFGEIVDKGDWEAPLRQYIPTIGKERRKLPKWGAKLLAYVMRTRGPKGVAFARATLAMKWARNWDFVRTRYPEDESRLVPEFAKRLLRKYGM
jgi:coenzyme F420 hydrogenase subunit beta